MSQKKSLPLFWGYIALFSFFVAIAPEYKGNRVPASISDEANCLSLVTTLINPKTKTIREGLDKFALNSKYRRLYMELFLESRLTEEEVEIFFNSLSVLPNGPKRYQLVMEYVQYTDTLFPKGTKKALALSHHLMDGSWRTHKGFKKFINRQKKFHNFFEKNIGKQLKKIQKESPELTERQAKVAARKAAREKADQFKQLYRGCYTKGMTQEHKAGGKAFTAFTISIAALSSGAFYTYANHDDPEFLTAEFFGKMGYEMVGDGLWAALASWIFKDPEGGFLAKSLKMYASDNVLIAADGLTWEKLFAEGEEDALARIEELKNDPNFKEEMTKLVAHLERNKFMDKVKAKFGELLQEVRGKDDENLNIDWDDITIEDLEKPEVQEALMEAALVEMYEEESGELSLGTYGADRWGYYSMIGIPFMFLDTIVTTKIYHTMCMAPLNPKAAILKASLIFTAYSIFYDTIAYPMRKRLIGE